MSLRNIVFVGALLIVLGATHAEAKGREDLDYDDSVCNPLAAGSYIGDDSTSGSSLLLRWGEIQPRKEEDFVEMEVNIPWGTKSVFYQLRVDCRQDPYHAIVVDNGFAQYDIGKNPTFITHRNPKMHGFGRGLRIYTGIKAPGFSGNYQFQKK